MLISVTMPMTIGMPIIAEIFSSTPVSQSPMNTTDTDTSEVDKMASASRTLS